MSRVTVAIYKEVYDEALRLVEAGEYPNMAELVSEAVRELAQQFEPVQHQITASLAGRTVQALMAAFTPADQENFDVFYNAYMSIVKEPPNDESLIGIIEIFKTYRLEQLLTALHNLQDSKLPLTPLYLGTMMEQLSRPAPHRIEPNPAESPPGTAAARAYIHDEEANPVLAAVTKLYEQEIGRITENIGQQLIALVADYTDVAVWQEAFEAAASMNKRNLRYIKACLRNYGKPNAKGDQKGQDSRAGSTHWRGRENVSTSDTEYYQNWYERLKAERKLSKEQGSS